MLYISIRGKKKKRERGVRVRTKGDFTLQKKKKRDALDTSTAVISNALEKEKGGKPLRKGEAWARLLLRFHEEKGR